VKISPHATDWNTHSRVFNSLTRGALQAAHRPSRFGRQVIPGSVMSAPPPTRRRARNANNYCRFERVDDVRVEHRFEEGPGDGDIAGRPGRSHDLIVMEHMDELAWGDFDGQRGRESASPIDLPVLTIRKPIS
jgi:hypothetical protein